MNSKMSSLSIGLCLTISSATFAGGMVADETTGNVTVPCQRSAFQLGLYGMYFIPGYSDQLSYIFSNSTVSNNSTRSNNINIHVNEHWNWSGMIEGGYHFNCGNDIMVSWFHAQNSDNQNFISSNLSLSPLNIFDNFQYRNSSSSKLTFNRFDAEMGQQVYFGEVKDIRFHGGFEYVQLEFASNTNGTGVINASFTQTLNKAVKFNGFGPRIGMDLAYYMLNGLSVYGKGSIAALVGKSYSTNVSGYTTPSVFAPGLTTVWNDKRDNQIVPVLSLKTGFKYTKIVYQNVYSLDVGYLWSDYIAIAQNLNPNTGRPSDANFYLQGPYVGIRWLGQASLTH